MAFAKGDKVTKTFHGLGGYTEEEETYVYEVEGGVVYVADAEGGRQEGITYDQSGFERENFFPGMYSVITKAAGS